MFGQGSADAETLRYVIVAWMALAVPVFMLLLVIPAPYGRYKSTWAGRPLGARLAWVLMELIAAVGLFPFYVAGRGFEYALPTVCLLLYASHYFYRAFLYPLMLPREKTVPVLIVVLGAIFNAVNVTLIGLDLFVMGAHQRGFGDIGVQGYVGLALFFVGFFVHVSSDRSLLRQKREAGGAYVVPRGGLFELVSCPNYLGEMVEWIGFALFSSSLAAWAFAVWTVANLLPRALAHHRWYRERFPNYPRTRKAVLPFLL